MISIGTIVALAVAAFVAYLLVCLKDALAAASEMEQLASAGWSCPETPPPMRGRYISRQVGKPETESLSTYWNGEKWCYLGGYECYFQRREWKPLSEGVVG